MVTIRRVAAHCGLAFAMGLAASSADLLARVQVGDLRWTACVDHVAPFAACGVAGAISAVFLGLSPLIRILAAVALVGISSSFVPEAVDAYLHPQTWSFYRMTLLATGIGIGASAVARRAWTTFAFVAMAALIATAAPAWRFVLATATESSTAVMFSMLGSALLWFPTADPVFFSIVVLIGLSGTTSDGTRSGLWVAIALALALAGSALGHWVGCVQSGDLEAQARSRAEFVPVKQFCDRLGSGDPVALRKLAVVVAGREYAHPSAQEFSSIVAPIIQSSDAVRELHRAKRVVGYASLPGPGSSERVNDLETPDSRI